MAEDIDKLIWIERPYRCDVTGNPVGTDTIKVGRQCPCQGCRADREIQSLRSRVSELEAERDAAEKMLLGVIPEKGRREWPDILPGNWSASDELAMFADKAVTAIRARGNTEMGHKHR